jgi:hypothetical protein
VAKKTLPTDISNKSKSSDRRNEIGIILQD